MKVDYNNLLQVFKFMKSIVTIAIDIGELTNSTHPSIF